MNTKSIRTMSSRFGRIILSLVMILSMVVAMMPVSFAAPLTYGITKSEVIATNAKIISGNTFTLNLTFDDYADSALSLKLVNKSTSVVKFSNNTVSQAVGNILDGTPISLSLQYLGTGTSFAFDLVDLSGNIVHSDTVFIDELMPSAAGGDDTPTPEYKANLILSNDMVAPTIKAGTASKFTVKIDNIANYAAIKAKAFLVYDAANPVFERTNYNKTVTLDVIQAGKTGDFTFDVKVPDSVKAGSYEIKAKIAFNGSKGTTETIELEVPVKVENASIPVVLGIVDTKVISGELSAGNSGVLELTLRNAGNIVAERIALKLSGFTADGVQLKGDLDTKNVGNLVNGDTSSVRYNLNVSKNVKLPVTLEAEMTYYDSAGKANTIKSSVYLPILGAEVNIDGIEANIVSQTKSLLPGGEGLTKVTVKNTTKAVQKDIKLTMTSDAAPVFLTPYTQMISKLNPGESKDMTFKYVIKQGTAANTYPVFVEVSLPGAETNKKSVFSGLTVTGETEGTSKPKIIVENYNYGADHILAGATFDLSVSFNNTSNVMGIRNAKFMMSSDDNVFIPVDSASSFFIDKIGAGETVEQIITLKAKADAKVQMYGITFKIEYEDQNGKSYDEMKVAYTAEEKISVNVKQEIRLEVADIVIAPENYVGTPVPLEVEFFNMGKSPMYNLMVKLEGNFQAQNSNYFVGNFEAGRSDFFSGSIIPEAIGSLEGKLIFAFEDETGTKQEVSFPIASNVIEGSAPGGDGMVNPEIPGDGAVVEPEKPAFDLPLWAWALIVVVPIGTAALVFLRIRKKKRLKALLEVADED